jgi:putative oxidoreductase
MNKLILIARVLLGLIFVVFSLNFWLHFIPLPPPAGQAGVFIGAMYASGYLAVVKVLELTGGILCLIGRTTLGLVFLVPIILNIILIDIFLAHAFNPASALAAVLALFLLWAERGKLAAAVR